MNVKVVLSENVFISHKGLYEGQYTLKMPLFSQDHKAFHIENVAFLFNF